MIAFFSFGVLTAQEAPVINKPTEQITPSPTVAALGTYGGVELKKSTGGINKNIPLLQLQQGMIQYNPSIEYYSTGVQVNEWGGRHGIGWSDNFSATIQRTVGTIPDEYSNQRLTSPAYQYFQSPATQEKYGKIISAEFNENLAHGTTNTFDPQYDIFSFNLFGKTGQFVIVNNTAVLLVHTEKTKIEILSTSPTYSFCLTDINGFKYFFKDEIEYTSLGVDEIVTPEIATAWFVNKIVSPLNDSLIFNYTTSSYASKSDFYQSYTFKNRKEAGDTDLNNEEFQDDLKTSQNSYGTTRTHIATKNLLSVVGDDFKLAFGYVSRADLIGGSLLKEIVLTDERNARVSKVQFEYDTYTASAQFQNLKIYQDDDLYPWSFGDVKVRYFLKEVKMGTDLFPNEKVHNFSYTTPQNLPPRFSLSQDEGGYFNGISNEWFIPRARVKDYVKANPVIWDFPMSFTGDRRTTDAAKTGILDKIVYPTGGVDSIEYDLNSYSTIIENENVTTYSGQIYNSGTGTYTASPDEFDWIACDRAVIQLNWDVYNPQTGQYEQDESGNTFTWFRIDGQGEPNKTFYVDGVARQSLQFGTGGSGPITAIFENTSQDKDIGLVFELHGQYVRVRYDLSCSLVTKTPGDLPLPGLRVKQVTTKSHISPDIVTRYDYRNFLAQEDELVFSDEISSHTADINNPYLRRFFVRQLMTVPVGVTTVVICADIFYYNAYSSSMSQLNLFNGNRITYSSVTELRGDTFTAGLFDIAVDQPGFAVYGEEFPLSPRENSAWNNGLELRRYYGTKNLSNYSVVKEQRWEYNAVNSVAVENCDFYRRYSSTWQYYCGGILTYNPFTIISYNLWNTLYYPSSFTEISYTNEGQNEITTTSNYSYDVNGLLTGEVRTDNKGGVVERTIRYPQTINAGTYASMSGENLLNYPVEETIRVNGGVVGSKLMTYRADNGVFVQDKAYAMESDVPLTSFLAFDGITKDSHYGLAPETEYVTYNASGKIVKIKDRRGIYSYYVWAYNNNYPVAKIESSVNTSISVSVNDANLSYSGISASVKNDITYLQGLISSYLNNLGLSSLSLVNVYTYKPLVGMTSQTDPNGVTLYYEYDDHGRLSVVKDDNEHIIKTYRYKYVHSGAGGQCDNYNFVRENQILIKNVTDALSAETLPVTSKTTTTTYFDGLGRPMQSVIKQGAPAQRDVVKPIVYDALGRESISYLPFGTAGNEGCYVVNATSAAQAFYATGTDNKVADDGRPFSETVFEPTPLNRPFKVYGAGEDWYSKGKFIEHRYLTNLDGAAAGKEKVIAWKINGSGMPVRNTGVIGTVSGAGYYPDEKLSIKSTLDEHANEVREYSDLLGRVLLKKVYVTGTKTDFNTAGNWAETYYIFDDLGNLRFVFQPELSKILSASSADPTAQQLSDFSFQYQYDSRQRMVAKKVPGADWTYMVYDARDRVVMTQDGNQRTITLERPVREWSFTKYDFLNRPVLTGIYTSDNTRDAMQSAVNLFYASLAPGTAWVETYTGAISSNGLGYDNASFPQVSSASQHLTVTYYDIYDSFIAPASSYGPLSQGLPGEQTGSQSKITGQVTGTLVKNLASGTWLRTVNYYDDRYRLIQSIADHTQGAVRISNVYDFVGKVLHSKRKYIVNGNETTIRESFTYDHAGRQLITMHSLNGGGDVIISANDYNELGQLVSKGLHSTSYPSVDPEIGQPGVVHEAIIERNSYSSSEKMLIATERVRLRNGYHFTASPADKVRGRIGFTPQEAAEKARTSGLFSQVIDYRYNIRGWLTRINNADVGAIADGNSTYDYFGMEFAYNNAVGGLTSTAAFNGNISAIKWSKGYGGPVASQAYTFVYDPINRLKDAFHFDYKNSTSMWLSNSNSYGESQTYDLNGNIKTLVRKGYMGGNLDNMEYGYTGNQLSYVHDTGDANAGFVNLNTGTDDYAYDMNGNLSKDRNKGINSNGDTRYNHLNLPREVIKGTESIKYIYDAAGRKLAQEVYSTNGTTLVKRTDYIGELVYEGTPGILQFIQHSEGRVVKDGSAWEYQYHLKDHLGSVRVSFTTKPQTPLSYPANFEDVQYGSGVNDFGNFNSYVNNTMDHTDAGSVYERIHELNGGYHGRIGMTKSLVVMPGDQITASVYARYSDLTGNGNNNPFLGDLAYAFGVSPGSVGEQLKLYNGLSSFAALVPQGEHQNDDDTAPKAFLTVLLFDNNYNLLDATWDQVSTTGASAHDLLSVSLKAKEPGFAYFFLSNEHPYDVRVFFDDLTLTHTPSPIFSASDYYPFGLTFNSYSRENTVPNKFKFGGKEEQTDLALNTVDWGWRQYDPAIGRWNVVDQWAEKYNTLSPYAFVANNPITNKEIDGRWYDEKNEKRAQKYEQKLDKRIGKLEKQVAKLEAKGKDVGDRRERISEMKQSKTDFSDMRKSDTEFRFAKLSDKFNQARDGQGNGLPVTARTGNNQITMFMEKNNFHEPRHGGQIARGEYNVSALGQTSPTYGAADEISAYRAEYAYRGKITYSPGLDLTNIQDVLKIGTQQTINNINQITPDFLKALVDTPGVNQQYIYKDRPPSWWSN